MIVCKICRREFEGVSTRKVCPECRADIVNYKKFYNSLKRPKSKICRECGKEFTDDMHFDYCPDCRTYEHKYKRKVEAQKRMTRHCIVCGKEIKGWCQYCSDECRKMKLGGRIQNLTLDITLFMMIVRGQTLKEAADVQMLKTNELKKHLDEQRDTPLYQRLTEYYQDQKEKREKRQAA